MSSEILTTLREEQAFKPAPPDYELALAHVSLATLGFKDAVEDRVVRFMLGDEEGLLLLIGPPGWGKSSLLEWACWQTAMDSRGLPISCFVAGTEALTPDAIARLVAGGVAWRLAPSLKSSGRKKLEKALATTVTEQSGGVRLVGGLTTPPLHGLSAQLSAEFASGVTTLARDGGWIAGPHSGLSSLADLARTQGLRLTIVIGDTDLWAAGDGDAAKRAATFFNALRSIHSQAEVKVILAVQDHWAEGTATEAARRAAREFTDLKACAARVLDVPIARSSQRASTLTDAMIARRVRITLGAERAEDGSSWSTALFDDGARRLLAEQCRRESPRSALGVVRDALDHKPVLPERLLHDDLMEVT